MLDVFMEWPPGRSLWPDDGEVGLLWEGWEVRELRLRMERGLMESRADHEWPHWPF